MQEIWENIKGYEGLYQVSNLGNVRRLHKDYRVAPFKMLKLKKEKNGYLRVGLSKNGKVIYVFVHRLVAQAFISNPNNYRCVNHKNEIRNDNCVDNLEWCTHLYNANYGNARLKMHNSSKKSKVYQYNLNMDLINIFDSITTASKITNSNRRYISQCCKEKHRTCNGYYWRYAQE